MKRFKSIFQVLMALLLVFGALGALPVKQTQAFATDLFFSEYIEGSSNNKAVEIFNGTGSPINLANYVLYVYANGAYSPTSTIALTGTLANNDVYVVAHTSASVAIRALADLTSGSLGHSGNDAVVLRNNAAGRFADVIGQVGYDPGSYWGTEPVTTVNHTLVRKCAINAGDPSGGNAFDPATEWDSYAVDTITYLGSHTTCWVPNPPVINEFSASTTGTDVEFLEVFGSPNTDYSAYTLLGIEGDASTTSSVEGFIDNIVPIGTTDANGIFVATPAIALENGTLSLLLVKDNMAVVGQDVDANDDGVIDATYWSEITDGVAVNDSGTGDLTYATPTLVALYDSLLYAPGGASRIPDGFDNDLATDWVRNDFDLAGIPGFAGTIVSGEAYNTPGALNQAYVEAAPSVVSTNPANGANHPLDTDITITFSERVTLMDPWFSISCATSGTHIATVTDADPIFALNPDPDFTLGESCTVTIIAANVVDDDTDDTTYNAMLANYTFTFTAVTPPELCGDTYTPIYDIQGTGETSPLAGTVVSTEGVVTGDFQVGGKAGYYIQDPTGVGASDTSDGIFVYNTTTAVNPGDRVRVRGTAVEYFGITEISSVTQVWICSTGNAITPTDIALPVTAITDFEKYESMLVRFPQNLVISEYFDYDQFGEIVLTSTRHMAPTALVEPGVDAQAAAAAYLLDRITLDDGRTSQNPDPAIHPNGAVFNMSNLFRGGDIVQNVTGVMDYGFGLYRIQPTIGATYTPVNARPAAPEITEGDLKVASFNVLNYFVTLTSEGSICGPLGNMECRGADNAGEFARQKAKILTALTAIAADIFGLMEIENDSPISGNDAVADLVAGLNAVVGADTYDYIQTGAIGGDAIKQAILYKSASVTPVGAFKLLTSTVDSRFIDTSNRPALAQVFTDNLSGVNFVIAVNHLKSKGSDCAGDPDLLDGQGNCNLTRTAAAQALVDWLANPSYFSGVQKALIIGDLNSYDKEDPIDAIKLGADDTASTADDFKDMIYEKRGDMAYGYVFDGQMGYLDHALANQQMAEDIVDVNFWHINADEPDLIDYDTTNKQPAQDALYTPDAYRSSDHDPVLVSLSFNNAPAAVEDAYSTAEDTQLVVATPGVLSNDTDIDLDILTAWLVADVAHGTLALSADGSFTYTPDLNFNGEDSFTYKAFDGTLYSNVVTVTITVTPANDAPVLAEIGAQSGNEDTLITFTASASDVDLPAQVLSFSLTGTVPTGTIIDALTGVFTWTPTDPGVYTFNVQVCDDASMALCDTEEITITVLAVIVNTAPVAVADPYSMIGNTELVVAAPGVLTNDSDADGDALTAVLVDNVTNGTLALADDGSFTYTPTAGFYGDASYTYKAFDGELYSEVVTVTITVIKPNGAPVALADAFTTAEDTQLVVDAAEGVLANDTDPDSVSLTAGLVDDVTKGTLSLAADGSFTYMPNAGFFGVDSFTYKAFDGESYSEVVTVTITVTEEIPVFFNIYLPLIFK